MRKPLWALPPLVLALPVCPLQPQRRDCPCIQGIDLRRSYSSLRELDQEAIQEGRGWTFPKIAVIFLLLQGYILPRVRSKDRFAPHIRPVSTWLTIRLLKVWAPLFLDQRASSAYPLLHPHLKVLAYVVSQDEPTPPRGWKHHHPFSSRQRVMWPAS